MMKYRDLQEQIQQKINSFPFYFAFSRKQLEKILTETGLTEKDFISIGAGGLIKKTDIGAYRKLSEEIEAMTQAEIAADQDGSGFVKDMFLTELADHEYSYTGDLTETLDALGYTPEEINNDPKLINGLRLAKNEIERISY